MEMLFKNMYPISDQVDVLVSNLIHKLNIYNVPDTVYQKCISTNTQNNLHTIFNARYYDVLREQLVKIRNACMFFANMFLPENAIRNEIIVSNLLYDILYLYITTLDEPRIISEIQVQTFTETEKRDHALRIDTDQTFDQRFDKTEKTEKTNKINYVAEYVDHPEFDELFASMAYFVQCSKKVINVIDIVYRLINNIFCVLKEFKLHGNTDHEFKEMIKALNYGSTSQTYFLENSRVVIKAYVDELRWSTIGHNDSKTIFAKELELLKKGCGPKLINFDEEEMTIKMEYAGESLYNNFVLPEDWKEQICGIFHTMDANNIFYPEFKIQNFLVLDGKITFVDFGLAQDLKATHKYNNENCEKFIRLLSLLNEKFRNIQDREQRYQLYSAFIVNMNITNIPTANQ